MSIYNWLFPTKEQRYKKKYDHLVGVLKGSEITTKEQVEPLIKGAKSRGISFSLVVFIVIAFFILTAEEYIPLWLILGAMFMAWIWSSCISATRIMKDYMDNELSQERETEQKEPEA